MKKRSPPPAIIDRAELIRSLKAAAEDPVRLSEEEVFGTLLNIVARRQEEFFAERRARADFDAFDRIERRDGGQPPAPEDQKD